MEDVNNDQVLVFLPGTPDPWSGSLVIVEQSQLQPLHLETLEVMNVFEKFGRGAKQVLDK